MKRMKIMGHWQYGPAVGTPSKRWGVRLDKTCASQSNETFLWRAWYLWVFAAGRGWFVRTPFYPGPDKAKLLREMRAEGWDI